MVEFVNEYVPNQNMKSKYLKYALYLLSAFSLTIVGVFLGQNFSINPFMAAIGSVVLILLFAFSRGGFKKFIFYIFCFGEGVLLTPTIFYYLNVNPSVIFNTVLATIIITTVALIVGYRTKSLSWIGGYLFAGLIGLLLLMLVSIFIPIPFISQFAALLFTAYIAYDINVFKRRLSETNGHISDDEVLNAVMDQFLNILNLFIHLLRIFADQDE